MDDQRDYAEEAANAALMREDQDDEPEVKKYLITVKLPKNSLHNPRNKVTGFCPVSGKICTDVTGEHHTFLHSVTASMEQVQWYWQQRHHVTRIEEV